MSFYNTPPLVPRDKLPMAYTAPDVYPTLTNRDEHHLFMQAEQYYMMMEPKLHPRYETVIPWLTEVYKAREQFITAKTQAAERHLYYKRSKQRLISQVYDREQHRENILLRALPGSSRRRSWMATKYSYPAGKQALKDLGERVATIMKEEDASEACDLVNTYRGDSIRFFHAVSDKLKELFAEHEWFSDNIRKCPHCNSLYHREDDTWRHSSYSGDTFCENCEDRYRYSSVDDNWLPASEAIPYYATLRQYENRSGDWVLQTNCVNFEDDDDGEDSNNPILIMQGTSIFAVSASVYLEIAERNDNTSGELGAYHGTPRQFRAVDARPSMFRPPLGIELEVYNEHRNDIVSTLRKTFCGATKPKESQIILERDGSLDRDYGFEIVTQPLGADEWYRFGPALLTLLRDKGTLAYQTEGTYGIHVNIGRKSLSPLQEARMMLFLCAEENRSFVQCIAQRGDIYSAEVGIGSLTYLQGKGSDAVRRIGGLRRDSGSRLDKKIMGRGKYCPINWKSEVGEFRIFQSTLNEEAFLKNAEFVWALYEWTHPVSATGSSWLHTDFLKWLGSRPQARKDYKNLLAFLRRPKHYTHGSSRVLFTVNPWLQYLTCKADASAELEEV